MRESLLIIVFKNKNKRNVTRRSHFIVTMNEKTLYLSLLPVWTLKDQDSIMLICELVRLDPPSGSKEFSDTEDQQSK